MGPNFPENIKKEPAQKSEMISLVKEEKDEFHLITELSEHTEREEGDQKFC